MEKSCYEFIDALIEQPAGLQATYWETIEYWAPDEPPVTTLFAALGARIAEDFNNTEMHENLRIFRLVETALTSGNTELATAVATGLIEAIIARAWRQKDLWPHISPMLGDLSRKHAEAWLAP